MQVREAWYKSENEMQRLTQGGVSKDVIDSAVTSFILQAIVQHGEPAERLCNKVIIQSLALEALQCMLGSFVHGKSKGSINISNLWS